MKNIIYLMLALFTLSVAAEQMPMTFEELDTDGDGYISKAEASKKAALSQGWLRADKDDDDRLDISEFSAFEGEEMFAPPEDAEIAEPGAAPFER